MTHPPGKVYRLRPGVRLDSYGDPVGDDWDAAERVLLPGAVIQSPSVTEAPDAALTGARQLFAPGALDLKAEDRIETEAGEVWRVEGDARVRHGLAMGTFTTAKLARVERRGHG